MKLTDEQKLEMYKRAIPYLERFRNGYCDAFMRALVDMGLIDCFDRCTYTNAWKIENVQDLQPFFKSHITSTFLLPYKSDCLAHRIKVLEYLIYHLELKLKKK